MNRAKNILTEVIQFVPIITLAFTFIAKGGVDLEQAGPLFVISGILAVGITIWLITANVTQNPILLASNIWLVVGALAFGVPIPALAALLSQTNAALLFAVILLVGITQTALKTPTGFIGMTNVAPHIVRRLSLIMLGLSAAILVWAVMFKSNIRLGGGLPFIVLNVTRRMLMRRATASGNSVQKA